MPTQPRILLARANRDGNGLLVNCAIIDIHDPMDYFYCETDIAGVLDRTDPHEMWIADSVVGLIESEDEIKIRLEDYLDEQPTLVIGESPSDLQAVLELITENEFDTIKIGPIQFNLDPKMPNPDIDNANPLEHLQAIQGMIKPKKEADCA